MSWYWNDLNHGTGRRLMYTLRFHDCRRRVLSPYPADCGSCSIWLRRVAGGQLRLCTRGWCAVYFAGGVNKLTV